MHMSFVLIFILLMAPLSSHFSLTIRKQVKPQLRRPLFTASELHSHPEMSRVWKKVSDLLYFIDQFRTLLLFTLKSCKTCKIVNSAFYLINRL